MNLRDKVRQWLGLDEIDSAISYIANSQQRSDNIARNIENKVNLLAEKQSAILSGISRCVAKLDANYPIDEQDPIKVVASKKLEDDIIRRLAAEAAARKPYNV